MTIYFHNEAPMTYRLRNIRKVRKWLLDLARKEGFDISNLNYVFCTDNYLHQINVDYLQHDTLTDIITFDQSEEENTIEGDIFISIERVKENAKLESVSMRKELLRVLAHGLLHLIGYDDKSASLKKKMREKEDYYLNRLQF